MLKTLDFSAEYFHQSLRSPYLPEPQTRQRYGGQIDYRITTAIAVGVSYSHNDEVQNSFGSQEYSLSWNLSSKISAGGILTINSTDGGGESRRGNARLTYVLGSQTTLFFTYSGNDFDEAGRARADSYQVGLKTGFLKG